MLLKRRNDWRSVNRQPNQNKGRPATAPIFEKERRKSYESKACVALSSPTREKGNNPHFYRLHYFPRSSFHHLLCLPVGVAASHGFGEQFWRHVNQGPNRGHGLFFLRDLLRQTKVDQLHVALRVLHDVFHLGNGKRGRKEGGL